jgi:hypothetical protein
MRPARVAAAVVLVAAAVLLALFGADVASWSNRMRSDDLRFRVDPDTTPAWTAGTTLPASWSRALLGLDDDRSLRRAVASFRTAYQTGQGFDNGVTRRRRRAAAEAALTAVGGGNAAQSQAQDLLGVLAFAGASSVAGGGGVDAAVSAFQNAVRLDPTNVSAQYNLELLLHELTAKGVRVGPSSAPGPRATGRQGAGAGTPGSGY